MQEASIPEWVISAQELKALMDSGKMPLVIDVREPDEYEEDHLPGSILIPLGHVDREAPKQLKTDQPFIVICAGGFRSLEGTLKLRKLGFKLGRSLEGGISYWRELGY